MRRIALYVLALAFVGITSPSHASILGNFLSFDGPQHTGQSPPFRGGGEDLLNDDSRGFLTGGDFVPNTGDILFGFISISEADPSPPGGSISIAAFDQISLLYSAQITDLGGGNYTLSPIADAGNPFDLRNLLHSDITCVAGLDDDSIVVSVSTNRGTSALDPDGSTADPYSTFTPGDMGDFNSTGGWMWDLTAGIVSATDFFQAAFSGGDLLERAGFTVQSHALGGGIVWLPVDIRHLDNTTDTTHDVTFTGTAFVDPTNGWMFADQGRVLVNPLPEPASAIVWALLGSGIAVAAAARRRFGRSMS